MGSVCCCMCDETEEFANLRSSVYRNCLCVRCFVQQFLCVYTALFRRGEEQTNSSAIQGTLSFSSTSSDNSIPNTYRSPPRPLPYDAEARYFRLQRDGLVLRREKGSCHSQEEPDSIRSDTDADSEPLIISKKWNESTRDDESKEPNSKSTIKLSTGKSATGFAHIYSFSSDDEDVCPTCLEEYTSEDPKILTKCSHHFHLGCIYEWMERSENCPVCGKEMAFDETT